MKSDTEKKELRVYSREYEEFFEKNRIKVNKYLNIVLWFFILAGPAIALGLKAGVFFDIDYITCVNISIVVLIMAMGHLILLKFYPGSVITCLFSLTALDILIFYITYVEINVELTWFLVPLLSLLFCNLYIFFYAVTLNYITMLIAVQAVSAHYASLRSDFDSSESYFADAMCAYTIETIIMVAAGIIICRLIVDYFKELFRQYEVIKDQEKEMKEKMDILSSMAEIYDHVNLIDFKNDTETPLRDAELEKQGIDPGTRTHSIVNSELSNIVMPDLVEDFKNFTNIQTVRTRLMRRKVISADFVDVVSGWFRAQFITVDKGADGIPEKIIYTTRNVDEEKRREEHLIRLSMTDEMTRLYNRRSYDEDLAFYKSGKIGDDFVLFSIDINGLKAVNDSKGHNAGDELIKGAADCLVLSLMPYGKIYRTGGDEFMGILHTDDPEKVRQAVLEKVSKWHGAYIEDLHLSVGYASHKEDPKAGIDELEKLADERMYSEKEKYYRENGIERR
ncbi:MAG: GGDEF domain-containing protein [Lachnospiraceae bacterium]|nr:GGDEF domain-containing protein [Lachnospiraceae bacterium]